MRDKTKEPQMTEILKKQKRSLIDKCCVNETLKQMIINGNNLLNHDLIPNRENSILAQIFMCTYKISQKCNLNLIEELDKNLKKLEYTKELDSFLIIEILRNINKGLSQDLFVHNKQSLTSFLIRLMYKKTKIDKCIKTYAFEILKKLDIDSMEELLIFDLPYFHNHNNFKVKFLLQYFTKLDSNSKSIFLKNIFTNANILKYENILKECKGDYSFMTSFVNFYLSTANILDGLSILLEYFQYFLTNPLDDTIKIIIKKIFNFLLKIVLNRNNKKRYGVSKFLINANLTNILFNKKKVFKMSKKLLKDKSTRIFELAICLLNIINREYLLEVLDNTTQPSFIIFILKYISDLDTELIYNKYLEVKSDTITRDFVIEIHNIPLFSKVYYAFHNKEALKYIYFKDIEISDTYVLDMVLYYSKYFPDRINEMYISSLLFDKSENILRNIKIINILTNIYNNIKSSLRKQLIEYLNTLLTISAYTKSIGQFYNKIQYFSTYNIKQKYTLVILGSMCHPEFMNVFNKHDWSHIKERALIYMLSYKPELGIIYKHKLNSLFTKDLENVLSKYNLLEFLYFLTIFIESEADDEVFNFYLKFIIQNKQYIYNLLESSDSSIKIQTCKLIYTCTINKILIPEESINRLVIHYKYDKRLYLYNDLIKSNIVNIFNQRILIYLKLKQVYDEYFLSNILKHFKFNISEFIESIEDRNSIAHTYLKFHILCKNFGQDAILENIYEGDTNLQKFIQNLDNFNVQEIFKMN